MNKKRIVGSIVLMSILVFYGDVTAQTVAKTAYSQDEIQIRTLITNTEAYRVAKQNFIAQNPLATKEEKILFVKEYIANNQPN